MFLDDGDCTVIFVFGSLLEFNSANPHKEVRTILYAVKEGKTEV